MADVEYRPSSGTILGLDHVSANDAGRVGGKAANLGELRRSGFPVPDGFVVLDAPGPGLEAALAALGGGPVAVRSSATVEDLPDASFAGQYETILDVSGLEAVRAAIDRCRQSATNERVMSYRDRHGVEATSAMAVLVQRMVHPDAAGVAFSANPVTGERREAVISAVRGLGERLVSGEARADEWVVREQRAGRRRGTEEVITSEQANAIADLARRSEERFGQPQDVEWALSSGRLYVLQSRPMTALPPPVDWTPPAAGYWMRNLRLGEWLPEPVTPLFEDWLLVLLNRGFARGAAVDAGLGSSLRQAIVNGWYYSTPQPHLEAGAAVKAVLTRPLTIVRFATSLLRQSTRPDLSERRYFSRVVRRWREEALPGYRGLVEDRTAEAESAPAARLFEIVHEVGEAAGEQLWCLAIGGGSAWKVEVALARFCRRHLAGRIDLDVLVLLAGLPGLNTSRGPHLVQSADWYRPTLGEMGTAADDGGYQVSERRRRLMERRQAAERSCREALAGEPALGRRFEILLELAQRYAQLREEQAFLLTLGWPVLRRCVLRLAAEAVERSAIVAPDDVFFTTRGELELAIAGDAPADLRKRVESRRLDWERQRRLAPPLALGTAPRLLQRMMGTLELLRSATRAAEGSLHGEPASPGRASGPVRVVRGPEDFDRFQAGEVLVAQATAPAWTPLFARAAAVVTDGGSLAAHASLVAREYGIPAVVATGDATARLVDGQQVMVDGSGGFVEILP